MKLRHQTSVTIFVLGLFLAPALALSADARPARPRVILDKGADADSIITAYGNPDEIRPMKKGGLDAAQWLYWRVAREQTTQTASRVQMITAFAGVNGDGSQRLVDAPVLDPRLVHITVYQVTALLMIDGRLELASQWLEKEQRYDN